MKIAKLLLPLITCCFLATPIAVACSVMRTTPEEKFRRADAVFIGKVVKIDNGVWFEVETPLKNLRTYRVRVIEVGGKFCPGYDDFILGERHLVYAKALKEPVGTFTAMGGTQRLGATESRPAQLPSEHPPLSPESAPATPGPGGQGEEKAVISALFIVAVFAGIGLLTNLIKYRAT